MLVAGIPLGGVSVLIFSRRSSRFVVACCCWRSSRARSRATEVASLTRRLRRSSRIGEPPRRIVSLNPATTEILFALGAGSRLVGRSDYDLWPDSARLVPALGNGIQPNVEAVLGTHPDLVVLYASQDNRPAAGRFRAAGVNTLSLKIDRIADFRRTVETARRNSGRFGAGQVGYRLGVSARSIVSAPSTAKLARPTVFWHIWDAPLITIGAGSFMNELVDIAGATNVYADIDAPIQDDLPRGRRAQRSGVHPRRADWSREDRRRSSLADRPSCARTGKFWSSTPSSSRGLPCGWERPPLSLANLLHPGAVR